MHYFHWNKLGGIFFGNSENGNEIYGNEITDFSGTGLALATGLHRQAGTRRCPRGRRWTRAPTSSTRTLWPQALVRPPATAPTNQTAPIHTTWASMPKWASTPKSTCYLRELCSQTITPIYSANQRTGIIPLSPFTNRLTIVNPRFNCSTNSEWPILCREFKIWLGPNYFSAKTDRY